MILMAAMGVLLLVGLTLTIWWGGTRYEPWDPRDVGGRPGPPTPVARPRPRDTTLRYLRGVAIALVGGFWAGALVTGPSMRLVMRLLAATASTSAQGKITEAKEVIGNIDLDGTIGLYLFGGIFPGLLSGGIYLALRRWLPSGRLGGVAFGALHLVIAATRIDPLRPDNPDFDLVGPGWLSVATFGLATVLHGMAVVAIANRYSTRFPPGPASLGKRARAVVPLALPGLMLLPGVFLVIPILAGLVATVGLSQVGPVVRAARGRATLVIGRLAVGAVAVALLPGTVLDLREVVIREGPIPVQKRVVDAGDARTG
ncbi:MAG: hypothetical protein ACRDV9_02030 [Acidimicrobiia bacterium]